MSEPFRRRLVGAGSMVFLYLLALALPAVGQRGATGREEEMAVHVYALRHQRATDALRLVLPLLSQRGSIELRPGGNTIVIREVRSNVERVLETLHRFDHEKRQISVGLWLIRATRGAPISPPAVVDPKLRDYPEVLDRLRDYLQYNSYSIVGYAQAEGSEGDGMSFDLSQEYDVRFRLGTVMGLERVPLEGFEVFRRSVELGSAGAPRSLIRSNLNSWLDRPLVLALSAGETDALLVVIRCELMTVTEGDS
ncbi:MAG: hypothetical protein K8J08_05905 [Thermoanaerobaculia bacterium]|nr:hypothetical protein [Thermoanaerobaculia bacterium]